VNQAPPNSDVLVLGAGLAGVSAALALGGGYRLVERESRPGGLCRTDVRDGFAHDVTGHWLHLRDPDVLALAHEVLPGGWLTVQRRAAIRSSGVFTRYPYQVNTQGLPPEVVAENVLGFIGAHLGEGGRELRERVPRNFAEFVLRHLGAGIARNFMFPYNEKLWTVPAQELTIEWMGRFVPRPTLEQVVRGALGLEGDAEGYNATFLYPREGGIETFVRALVARLPRAPECGVRPVSIDPIRKVALLSTGEEVRYRAVISSVPLPEMVSLVGGAPPPVVEAARLLRAATVTYVNVAARDVGAPPWHWVYVPERTLRPYRVGSASAAVPSLGRPGFRSFYVEMSGREAVPPAEAEAAALEALLELGMIGSPADVRFTEVRTIPQAYVIHDRAYGPARDAVRQWLAGLDVLVAGRSGNWEYSSMEDALLGGRQAARQLKR
jgi:protoporphyrinogen oxidase